MNRFHVCKKVKSFLLIALSVAIMVCSVPSFSIRSQALEAGAGYLGSLAVSEYLSLVTYLLSRGYSAPKIVGSENTDAVVSSTIASGKASEVVESFINAIKANNVYMASKIQSALSKAAKSGKLILTEEEDAFIRGYFESLTVDSSMVVGSVSETFEPISAGSTLNMSWQFVYRNTPDVIYTQTASYTVDFDYLPLLNYNIDSDGLHSVTIYFLPTSPISTAQDALDGIHLHSTTNDGANLSLDYDPFSGQGYVPYVVMNFSSVTYMFSNFNLGHLLTGILLTNNAILSIIRYFRLHGVYDQDVDYISTQVTDTSNTDVLSYASQVDSVTGDISGGLTVYLPDMDTLINTLQDFYDGTISWINAIKQLGLSSVSSDATVSEKENALDKVATPDSTYEWITSTIWGSDTITETVTNNLVDTQSQEGTIAEELAEQYSDNAPEEPSEEDKNKGGLAMLIATALLYLGLWDDPSTDPTNPDSGGIVGDPEDEDTVPWLVDTLTAIPVASGILGDVFDAAGGTNGFGFIYTVGISFVLFSVIIGAGHFFGALGSEIQARSQENDIKADHEYNKQQAYKAYREGLISKRELYRMTRK